ncbi:hypothetical protein DFH94DRAFT_843192 [Russula ochroleuca]|uniref:HTH cro/C1-type domain-containing protein n=1 Tax=Russula ochroleuca TaxID=152965 RepID=A0A9P5N151_9AGAM|nr:hypothetical protein DFH94DRAFT_843192 [Russula ochroleuca]
MSSSEIQCTALKSAIERQKVSYKQIAKNVGTTESRIIDIVSGRERPTQQEFNRLATALGIANPEGSRARCGCDSPERACVDIIASAVAMYLHFDITMITRNLSGGGGVYGTSLKASNYLLSLTRTWTAALGTDEMVQRPRCTWIPPGATLVWIRVAGHDRNTCSMSDAAGLNPGGTVLVNVGAVTNWHTVIQK